MFKIDPATNLPELPENYFWRIKLCTNPFSSQSLEIQIRKKILFYSAEQDSMYCNEDRIPYWAKYLAVNFYSDLNRHKGFDRLLGDYPPKKLGD